MSGVFRDLRRRAGRVERRRFVVGAGGCGLAVGAEGVLEALRREVAAAGLDADVIAGGCNGMCYAAVLVTVLTSPRPAVVYGKVAPGEASRLVAAVRDGQLAEGGLVAMGSGVPGVPSAAEHRFFAGQRRRLCDRWGLTDPGDLEDAVRHGAYAGLARALEIPPQEVVDAVTASGLVGRGGASFPTGTKWQGARDQAHRPKYLVVNAEEGEPGVFKDRHMLEGDPHRLIEGLTIAAYAIGADRAIVFINGEAEPAGERFARALEQARAAGIIGERVLGSDFDLVVEVRRGAGGYILGEETALLNAIEGYRSQPRVRPPFPVESGLWGRPTVINNVETLCNIPAIVLDGADRFREVGTERFKGTKLIGVSGNVERPGMVEVPMGTTLRQLIFGIAGGVAGGRGLKAVLIGGPSGNLIPPALLDVPMEPGAPVIPGTGGHVVIDDRQSAREVVKTLMSFNARESCGKCTPCREGTPRMRALLDRLEDDGALTDLATLRELTDIVQLASLCGLGQMAAFPIQSGLRHFADELAPGAPGTD